jgi:signal transduction histidine kinase
MTTILKISKGTEGRNAALAALRDAGVGVIEVDGWEAASDALRDCEAALVVCDGEVLEGIDTETLKKAIAAIGGGAKKSTALPADVARSISHELRTPLSAMSGWLHLMESGKLDAEAMKRAIQKLRANIDDQVRTIDRCLGEQQQKELKR